ncbi:serine/threonine kinase with two-component sensor domain [Rivularia sp. IAM M-261]|nr:serine/threonine kinase with two-component sensor domain [Rivularia sp. IAM M-261]
MATASHTPTIPGYQVLSEVYAGSRTLVYRAIREHDSLAVVIKLLACSFPNFNELLQFRNQYAITKNLNIPGIVHPLLLEPYGNSYVLVMEDNKDISLREYIGTTILSLVDVLVIAIQLTDILHNLHKNRIIHKDIKPANILISPETKQVKLIDFSIASLLPKETQEIKSPNVLEGTLAYISPEQTGRMNRGIDYRSDFYSLGITFYELITGQLPFIANDAMELVHCHIAQVAVSVSDIKPEIPQVISKIINKLIAKNAEDRYQSTFGLKSDLEYCLYQLKNTGTITDFEIGKRDLCERFLIPEKLYGREAEVKILLAAFERVASHTADNSKSEMMLVAGFSGIGKTAVINEIHKPITRSHGYFIKGKFDQFNRNIPLSAFVQALRDLIVQLLSESDARQSQWQVKILEAVGNNGQVLIEVVPELERLIGKQPPALELSGTAQQNRFNLLFLKFIEVFTTPQHPLVIFLDDLQWADSASLQLIKLLMGGKGYLLLLGAYRDNEVQAAHPFMLTVEELKKTNAIVNTITLAPLIFQDINRLVAETLNCSTELSQPLAELVQRKTQGNPFFITQFLKALHEDGYIISSHAGWECDIAKINALSLTEDVVEFMATQLHKLPHETRRILTLAACIGNQFDLATLTTVSEQSDVVTAIALWKALQEGLVIPQNEVYKFYLSHDEQDTNIVNTENVTYRFLHDRVQQASYSLIPEDQKQETHLKIGRLLLPSVANGNTEQVFDIAAQFNAAVSLITDPQEQIEIAQLNLAAAQKAKAATAYKGLVTYASTGIELMGVTAWQENYELTLQLYEAAAEGTYLLGEYAELSRWVEPILQQAKSLEDKIKVYELQVFSLQAQNCLQEAIDTALGVLKQLDIFLPAHPNKIQVLLKLGETKLKLLGKTQDLIHLPTMNQSKAKAAMQILSSALSTTYIARPDLLPLNVFEQVKLSLKYGNTNLSAFAYSWYALILSGVLQDIESGYQFAKLALELLEKFGAKEIRCRTLFMVYCFVYHWHEPLGDTIAPLRTAYTIGLESGDLEYACWSLASLSIHQLFIGEELSTLSQEFDSYRKSAFEFKQSNPYLYVSILHQTVSNLLGYAANPSRLEGDSYKASESIAQQQQSKDGTGLSIMMSTQIFLSYLFADYQYAYTISQEAIPYLEAGTGLHSLGAFHFYESLVYLAIYPTLDVQAKKEIKRKFAASKLLISKWAKHSPTIYQHKRLLILAEEKRVYGKYQDAATLYEQAIAGANKNGYIHEEGLANELAAKFYLEWDKVKAAQAYMQAAYFCYAKWGAKAKIDDLEQRYPQLIKPIIEQRRSSFNHLETIATIAQTSHSSSTYANSTNICDALDFSSVLKAAQKISSSIELDELVTSLTHIILENSGAKKAVLILEEENTWQVRAITSINQQGAQTILNKQSIDICQDIPIRIINYVKSTQETVVIDNCQTNTQGLIGEYMRSVQPKSLLCTPIINQGHLVGILYLENQITSGVFTQERLQIINLLSSQAAISLENARLYQKSQQAFQDLQQAQLQIVQSEKMSALGNLVAGVAHEMNNPLGFISATLEQVKPSFADVYEHLKLYQESFPNPGDFITDHAEEIDLDYTLSDLPQMVDAMSMACNRLKNISTSLRTFSRADRDYKVPFNIHDGIDSTILILKHRLKANEQRPAIDVITEYGNLPQLECFPGQLNQVFMNIIANAIDALDEFNTGRSFTEIKLNPNRIIIKTSMEDNQVKITIADNGKGMSEDVKKHIFDHLFTTKVVGKGTGLGLAIAKQIVEENHGGKLSCNSVLGEGTEFIIVL